MSRRSSDTDRRAKATAMRAQQAARERRRRRVLGGAAAAVVLAVVVGVGIAVQAGRNAGDGPGGSPTGVTADGGVVRGDAGAPVDVALYEDFQCPACASFEERAGDTLTELMDGGEIQLTYHPIAFLDRASTDRYSTRSLNAVACVIDTAPVAFLGFYGALFAAQPAEGGPGLTDDELVTLAEDAGADGGQVAGCVENLTFETWTQEVTDSASQAGVNQTPTVLVDGEPLTDLTATGLRDAVRAAG